MAAELKIGDRIRARGAINDGTLGFFCSGRNNITYLASCDHVLKTQSTPDGGPWNIYFERNAAFSGRIARFEGMGLVDADTPIADFAVAKTLLPVNRTLELPAPLPYTRKRRFTGVASVHSGQKVVLWGAATQQYLSAVILAPEEGRKYAWPHVKYGLVEYEYQFSVALQPEDAPRVGDSGGYVVTRSGQITGLIAALSGETTETGSGIVHCVPVKQCLERLNLELLTSIGD